MRCSEHSLRYVCKPEYPLSMFYGRQSSASVQVGYTEAGYTEAGFTGKLMYIKKCRAETKNCLGLTFEVYARIFSIDLLKISSNMFSFLSLKIYVFVYWMGKHTIHQKHLQKRAQRRRKRKKI